MARIGLLIRLPPKTIIRPPVSVVTSGLGVLPWLDVFQFDGRLGSFRLFRGFRFHGLFRSVALFMRPPS